MIIPVVLLLALLAVPLRGGSLARLGDLRFRLAWCAAVALVGQVVLFEVVDEHVSEGPGAVLHLLTYVPAVAFVVANRALPGVALSILGAGLNLAAIVANEGVMPASSWARDVAGIGATDGVANAAEVADARVLALGDVLAVPGPWPIGSAFSIGDVLLVIGGIWLIHRTCVRRGDRSADADDLDPEGVAVGGLEADGLAGLRTDQRLTQG